MEKLVHKLAYSPIRQIAKSFSHVSPLTCQASATFHAQLIDRVESRVYGATGLREFELHTPSRIKRLAYRSLAQYLCQRELMGGSWSSVLRRFVVGLATPLLLVFWVLSTLLNRRKWRANFTHDVVVFMWAERLAKFAWADAFEGRKKTRHTECTVHLGRAELRFLLKALSSCPRLVRYPELLANLIRWLGYYGGVMHRYAPKTVANFFEGVASSSLMTAYLGERGCDHVNVQHGELFFSAFNAFAEFDEFRVWSPHFRELLAPQRCSVDRAVLIAVPFHRELFCRLRHRNQPRSRRLLIIDPFLHNLLQDSSEHLLSLLMCLDDRWEVKLRRHPADRHGALKHVALWNRRLSEMGRSLRVVEEPPSSMSIEAAIGCSRVVASITSTAMLEAWVAGCKLVYIPGGPGRDAVMNRHMNSPNVWYLGDEGDLGLFVNEPALLDEKEQDRVDQIVTAAETIRPMSAGIDAGCALSRTEIKDLQR